MLSHTSRQSETACDHRDVETTPAPSLEASLNVTNIGKGRRACDKMTHIVTTQTTSTFKQTQTDGHWPSCSSTKSV